jgi:alkaline phosphatase D
VKQTIDWLHMPEDRRPHLILLYFSEVDSAGHVFGADSNEVKLAVREVDESIGELLAGIASVRPQINVVVVSDHGMANIERFVDITDYADFGGVRVVNEFSHVMVYSDDAHRLDRLKAALEAKRGPYHVFRRAETPAHLRFSDNPRIGDLVILPAGRYYMYVRTPELSEEARHPEHRKGWHGWDPRMVPEMGAFFCAAGPQIRSGERLRQVQNTDVFLLLAGILGLSPPEPLDGTDALVKALHVGAPR